MLSHHTTSNDMSAHGRSESGDDRHDSQQPIATTSFDSTNRLITAPLAPTSQPGEFMDLTTDFFANPTTDSTGFQQFRQNDQQSVDLTNLGQPQPYQHQNAAHAQFPRPGPAYPQQQWAPTQNMAYAAFAEPTPEQLAAAHQSNAAESMRNLLYHQADEFVRNTFKSLAFNLGNQGSMPIERSLSDMGPRSNADVFGPLQHVNLDSGLRPRSSQSMGDFRFPTNGPQRPFTPPNQISGSSDAPSPFDPATPPHQVQSEAVDVLASLAGTPSGRIECVNSTNGDFDDFMDLGDMGARHSRQSSHSSIDCGVNQSPSKYLGASLSNLSFEDTLARDVALASTSNSIKQSSPELSDTESSSGDPEFIYIPTGVTEEDVLSYLTEDGTSEKYPIKCTWPGCDSCFARTENGKSHVQTHLGDRPYHCPQCGRRFTRIHDCKRHYRGHSPKKMHKCPCGFENARKDALTRHQERVICDHVQRQRPEVIKTPAKRGRPRKNRPLSTDDGRITKSSPKKTDRKRFKALGAAISARMPALLPCEAKQSDPATHGVVNDLLPSSSSYHHQGDLNLQLQASFPLLAPSANSDHTNESMSLEDSDDMYSPAHSDSAPLIPTVPSFNDASLLNGNVNFTPPMSPTGPFSTGFNSPAKHDRQISPRHETPPGSPPELSSSPAASSMGGELPSSGFDADFESTLFADIGMLKNYHGDNSEDYMYVQASM